MNATIQTKFGRCRCARRPSFPVDGSSAEVDARVKQRVANALSVYEVFQDVLEQLQPTHVITQTQCRVCAVSLEDVERALAGSVSSRPRLVSLEPNALADIWSDIRRVAAACGVEPKGDQVVQALAEANAGHFACDAHAAGSAREWPASNGWSL